MPKGCLRQLCELTRNSGMKYLDPPSPFPGSNSRGPPPTSQVLAWGKNVFPGHPVCVSGPFRTAPCKKPCDNWAFFPPRIAKATMSVTTARLPPGGSVSIRLPTRLIPLSSMLSLQPLFLHCRGILPSMGVCLARAMHR